MKIGYARVSTRDQNLDAQTDALHAAGCERIYVEKASGKLDSRPELDKALDHLREGDTLVVTKLDRLGRSLKHLLELSTRFETDGVNLAILDQGIDTSTPVGRMFFAIIGAVAQFERELLVERTKAGLDAARARGRVGGGRWKMTPTRDKQARTMYDSRQYSVQQIADAFGVSRPAIYRALERTESTEVAA